jgi:hypothetical protein
VSRRKNYIVPLAYGYPEQSIDSTTKREYAEDNRGDDCGTGSCIIICQALCELFCQTQEKILIGHCWGPDEIP